MGTGRHGFSYSEEADHYSIYDFLFPLSCFLV